MREQSCINFTKVLRKYGDTFYEVHGLIRILYRVKAVLERRIRVLELIQIRKSLIEQGALPDKIYWKSPRSIIDDEIINDDTI